MMNISKKKKLKIRKIKKYIYFNLKFIVQLYLNI